MFGKSCGITCPKSTKCQKWIELYPGEEKDGVKVKVGRCAEAWAVIIAIETREELTKIRTAIAGDKGHA